MKKVKPDVYILANACIVLAGCIKALACMTGATDDFIKERLRTVYEDAKSVEEKL